MLITKKRSDNKLTPKNYWLFLLLTVNNFCNWLFLLLILLFISTINHNKINNFFNIDLTNDLTWLPTQYAIKAVLIISLLLIFIVSSCFFMISLVPKWNKQITDYYLTCFILTILSFNLFSFIYLVSTYYSHKQNIIVNAPKIKKKWTTADYILIAYISAITLILLMIHKYLPQLPSGGGLALYYLPLMGLSFTKGFWHGCLAGVIVAVIHFLFSNLYIISPWSYLLDYVLPLTTPAIVAFLSFKISTRNTIFTYINYFIHCLVVLTLVYVWQVLSGYLIWLSPPSWSSLFIALIYNFVHIYMLTFPFLLLLIPKIYRIFSIYFC